MGRPPVSIQMLSRGSGRKEVREYEVWVHGEQVGRFPSLKKAHAKADEFGGAPGWGRPDAPDPMQMLRDELDGLRAEVTALKGGDR